MQTNRLLFILLGWGVGLIAATPAWAGPEPNNFVCPSAPSGAPASAICKYYGRPQAGGGLFVALKVGNDRFGFRHIRKLRGFSNKTDRLIGGTINSGSVTNEGGGSFRYVRYYSRRCTVRVIWSESQRSIITAYRIDPGGKGYFDACP